MNEPERTSTFRFAVDRRIAAVGLIAATLVAGIVWNVAAYDSPLNKCRRGDIQSCRVVVAQEEQGGQPQPVARPHSPAPPSASPPPQVLALEQATCATASGKWDSSVCRINYRSQNDGQIHPYVLSFDSGGNVVPAPCGDDGWNESHDCFSHPVPLQQARIDCLNGSYTLDALIGYWHSDTDICSL
jgi:hypothetical protein